MHNRINQITLLHGLHLDPILSQGLFGSFHHVMAQKCFNYLAHRKNDHTNTTNAAQEK